MAQVQISFRTVIQVSFIPLVFNAINIASCSVESNAFFRGQCIRCKGVFWNQYIFLIPCIFLSVDLLFEDCPVRLCNACRTLYACHVPLPTIMTSFHVTSIFFLLEVSMKVVICLTNSSPPSVVTSLFKLSMPGALLRSHFSQGFLDL